MENTSLIVQEIIDLYERFGNEQYGENITQTEHAIQAALLAQQGGFNDELIIAALLHDIGHLLTHEPETKMEGNLGAINHEELGANYLEEKGFSSTIYQLVRGHVTGKRYLTYKYPIYFNKLSEASKKTLVYQGGKMTTEEADNFEKKPLFKLSLKMREWDDEAKIESMDLPCIKDFSRIIETHLKSQLL